jgi:hypothetical protein
VLLLGPDHPAWRETAVAGIPACRDGTDDRRGGPAALGAALSAGWLPKAVPSVEPNEDGVLLAAGRGGLLLAVADGHGGSAAATAALRALAAASVELLDAGTGGAGCLDGAARLRGLAAAAVDGVADLAGPARTALGLALVADGWVFSTGYGDTVTMLVRRGRPRVISAPSAFLGPGTRGSQDAGRPIGQRRQRPGDAVLIVSDGVPDFLGRAFLTAVGSVLLEDRRTGGDALAVARALVGRAGVAGAGDNITAAVLVSGRSRPRRGPLSWRRPRTPATMP